MRLSLLWLIVLSAAVSAQSETFVLVGRVQQIYSPRLLTVENRLADGRRVLVLLPERSSPPPAGTVIYARGVLRRLEEAQVGERAWSAVDAHARSEFAGRPVLVAESLESPVESMTGAARQPLPVPMRGASPNEISVRPWAITSLIGELAGLEVRLPYARVVDLLDQQAFVIESLKATIFTQPRGFRDRVLVLVNGGALRVPADSLVASTVTVVGVARTLLGVQASGDAPWPLGLDPGAVKRLDIRAAVIATSVRTADGVELTDRPQTR